MSGTQNNGASRTSGGKGLDMSDRHTPGPWRIEGESGDSPYIAGAMPSGEPDHVCQIIETPDGEDHANAALIAAAPELLQALRALLDQHMAGVDLSVRDRHEWCRAAAAIAKAEGKV